MLEQIETVGKAAELYPKLVYDLTTESGRKMADAFAGFDIDSERAKLRENFREKLPKLPEW